MQEREGPGGGDAGKKKEKSAWEGVVAGISALLVVSALGFIVYDGLSAPEYPAPRVEVTVDTILELETGFLVEFTAQNRGHSTAAALLVEGELRGDTGTVETAQTTFNFLPAGASRRGGLYFSRNPHKFSLHLRPKGYERP